MQGGRRGGGIPRNFHEFPLMSLLLSTVIITCPLISELSLTMMLKVEGTVSVCRVGTKEEMLCIFLFSYNFSYLLFLNIHHGMVTVGADICTKS